MLKKYLISFIYFFLLIIISTFFITIVCYFSIFNNDVISIIKLLIPMISIFISSFKLGKETIKRGYVEGLKFGFLVVGIFICITLLFKEFNFKSIIYYIILLLSSVFGSMIGINLNKTK